MTSARGRSALLALAALGVIALPASGGVGWGYMPRSGLRPSPARDSPPGKSPRNGARKANVRAAAKAKAKARRAAQQRQRRLARERA